MRSLPATFDPEVVAAIDGRLAGIEAEHGVSIPWAIESGSRAWGFPSPDSDYDCRFLYVRSRESYLSLWPARDVIETPLDAVLDVNGWDVVKALRLAVSGNATVGEWLRSPLVYRGDPAFRDLLVGLVDTLVDPARLRRHHLHVGRDQWNPADLDRPSRLKKVFYAVRPAVTLRWLEDHTGVPPMNLDELLEQTDVPDDVRAAITDLRERKARTRELGAGPVPEPIRAWVTSVLAAEDDVIRPPDPELKARADAGFLEVLARWAPADRVE